MLTPSERRSLLTLLLTENEHVRLVRLVRLVECSKHVSVIQRKLGKKLNGSSRGGHSANKCPRRK